MSNNGFNTAPARYTATEDGRETCDRMRDLLGDEGFAAACQSNVIKYTDRAGRKGDWWEDMAKAWWWCRMYLHVRGEADDPRSGREGFVGYSRLGLRNCWTCRYDMLECAGTRREHHVCGALWSPDVVEWVEDHVAPDSPGVPSSMPPRDADGCPGFAPK